MPPSLVWLAVVAIVAQTGAATDTIMPPFLPQTSMPTPAEPFIFLHLVSCIGRDGVWL
jgi:hypothetical protein